MQSYSTILIGSGFSSVGYAMGHENTLILEEQEIADTHFYLPLRSFRYAPYTPKTEEGRRLLGIFRELSLFSGEMQNTNGFECALCRYLGDAPVELLLKSRVVGREETSGRIRLRVATNEGILTFTADRVIDTRACRRGERYTVLYQTKDPEAVAAALSAARPDAVITPAFYEGRYALHVDRRGEDENRIKLTLKQLFAKIGKAKVVYMAPIFASAPKNSPLSDDAYDNPIRAFEAGYLFEEDRI